MRRVKGSAWLFCLLWLSISGFAAPASSEACDPGTASSGIDAYLWSRDDPIRVYESAASEYVDQVFAETVGLIANATGLPFERVTNIDDANFFFDTIHPGDGLTQSSMEIIAEYQPNEAGRSKLMGKVTGSDTSAWVFNRPDDRNGSGKNGGYLRLTLLRLAPISELDEQTIQQKM